MQTITPPSSYISIPSFLAMALSSSTLSVMEEAASALLKPYVSLLAPILSLLLAVIIFARRSAARRRGLPPGPRALPIVGHLHLLHEPAHQCLHSLSATYGPLLLLRLGSTPCVVVSSPDLAKEFMKTHDAAISNRPQTAASRHFAYDSSGFAFAPYGPYYRFMRRLCMSELLGAKTVEQLRPVRRTELLGFLRSMLSKSSSREAVDLSWELIRLTNNEMTRMAAGTAAGDTEEARELVKQVAELVGAFNVGDFVPFLRGLDLQGLDKRIRDVRRRFDVLMERIIEGKEEMRRNGGGGGERKKGMMRDLLDMLLDVAEDEKAEMRLTREHIKGFILDIFTAGSDSTAATIEWALAELLNHPTILHEVINEIDQVVGRSRLVEEDDIPSLPYIQAVIKETLRLHPPAPVAHRESITDVTVNGYHIPAGTAVMLNIWSIGRNPSHWEDPLEFRPRRFLGSTKDSSVDVRGQHYQLVPFGSGRRGCPGVSLALQVVQVTVAALVQCFEWEVVSKDGRKEGAPASVNMDDGFGLVVARAKPLVCVPVPRLDPFPSLEK